jgi:hypothetical protein
MGNDGLQVAIVPWLKLDGPITTGGRRIEPAAAVLPRLEYQRRERIGQVCSTFRNYDGLQADVSLLWPEPDGDIPALEAQDTAAVTEVLRLLALAVVSSERFFTDRTPINASHFEVVFQSFNLGSDYATLWTRRRDGETLSGGYRLAELRFTRPLQALTTPLPRIDAGYLAAVMSCRTSKNSALRRIVEAADPFRRANLLDPGAALDEDVFWAMTALEQLVVTGRSSKTEKLRRTVSGLAKRGSAAEVAILREWASEAYETRSEVHGKGARTSHWMKWVHALIAVEAFSMFIRRMLIDAGRYTLTDDDELRLYAFPLRVAALRSKRVNGEGGAAEQWDLTIDLARSHRTSRAAARHLDLQLGS